MLWRRLAYNTSLVERLDEEVEPLVSLLIYVGMHVFGLLFLEAWIHLSI